jgi:sialidase-1
MKNFTPGCGLFLGLIFWCTSLHCAARVNVSYHLGSNTALGDSLPSENFFHLYGDLNSFLSRVKVEKRATVAFLGGSITAGRGWRDQVMAFLETRYPTTKWTFINAGIPSLGSVPHAFRLQRDVLSKGPVDLLFVESAVNDLANGTSVVNQRRALEGIVRHARKVYPAIDVVLMAFADEIKVEEYYAEKVPVEVQVHEDVARHYQLPFINLAKEVAMRIKASEFTWKDDFKDLHPSPFGHQLYFRTIGRMIEKSDIEYAPPGLPRKLPLPLDEFNYDNGEYLNVTDAKRLNGFVVDPAWTPDDSAKTRPRFVGVPMLVGDSPGDSFEFSFAGDAVGLALVSGPDAGVIRYSIDGGVEQEKDLFTQWSRSLHLPWYVVLGDGLKNGKHKLRVTLLNAHNAGRTRSACRIVHLLVNR